MAAPFNVLAKPSVFEKDITKVQNQQLAKLQFVLILNANCKIKGTQRNFFLGKKSRYMKASNLLETGSVLSKVEKKKEALFENFNI